MPAQTSDRMSAIASAYLNTAPKDIIIAANSDRLCQKMASDIRAMAASLLRQDEVRGSRMRNLFKRVIGR